MAINRDLMKDAAKDYISRGWRVAPLHWPKFDNEGKFVGCSCGKPDCDSPGKHPFAKLVPHGLKDATIDLETVEKWWSEYPLCNIAIATGPESNLVMVGPDDEPGPSNWKKMQEINGEINTRVARSGRASRVGSHNLFLHPGEGIYIKNQVDKDGTGIDIRGDGGYFVAAPSMHMSGHRYEWLNNDRVVDMPTFLLNWLLADINPLPQADEPEQVIEPAKVVFDKIGKVAALSQYAEAALRGEVDSVRSAREGTRNDSLNKAAFKLGTLVGANMLDETVAVAELTNAAKSAGLNDGEIEKTIKSGMESGKGKPRPVPEPQSGPVAPPAAPPDEANEDDVQEYLARAPRTDTGNAEVFAYLFGDRVRWCVNDKRWKIWNGSVWSDDETMRVDRLMTEAMRRRRDAGNRQAAVSQTDQGREAGLTLAGYAMRCENAKPIQSALDRAKTLEQIVTRITEYDRDNFLITAGDVTINLRDGSTYSPRPTDYITKKLGVAYDPKATCPRWEQFIQELWPDEPEMWRYMQRVVGYALTGDMREEKLFMLLGKGSNGKSVFVNALNKLMGDHYGNTPFTTFDADKRNEATNDLASLRGRRVVSVSEVDENRRLAEARVKMATTGIDTITARYLYCEYFSFYPTFKVFMALNHLPGVGGTDDGIWRRIELVKFGQRFCKPGDDRRPGDHEADLQLEAKLAQELPGILNWAIEGCVDWQEQGLNPPASVTDLTRQYRKDSDVVGLWADQYLVEKPGVKLYSKDGYKSFQTWATEVQGIQRPMSQISWSKQMVDHGFTKAPKPDRDGPYFEGVALAYEPAPTVRFS